MYDIAKCDKLFFRIHALFDSNHSANNGAQAAGPFH